MPQKDGTTDTIKIFGPKYTRDLTIQQCLELPVSCCKLYSWFYDTSRSTELEALHLRKHINQNEDGTFTAFLHYKQERDEGFILYW